jgi:hypothetical protein
MRTPRKDLGIDCTVKEQKAANIEVDYSNRKKRQIHELVGFGGREVLQRIVRKKTAKKKRQGKGGGKK